MRYGAKHPRSGKSLSLVIVYGSDFNNIICHLFAGPGPIAKTAHEFGRGKLVTESHSVIGRRVLILASQATRYAELQSGKYM